MALGENRAFCINGWNTARSNALKMHGPYRCYEYPAGFWKQIALPAAGIAADTPKPGGTRSVAEGRCRIGEA